MKKIGILGGTFNPIHAGHLMLAEGASNVLGLDCVLFVPCNFPPHKNPSDLVSAKDRIAMVRLAIKGNSSFKVSMIELKRGGKSYSVDTLKELHKKYKGKAKFFFIIGSDSFSGLKKWKDVDELIKLCTLVAAKRPGYNFKYKGIKLVDIPTLHISSTEIRRFIKNDIGIKYLVPDSVRKYIGKRKLYK
jgi:nicotinate-nucleotide adenylyltransferase